MSRLDELIQELCPDGVEYSTLGEKATIVRGASPRPIAKFVTTAEDGVNWIKIGDVKPESKYIESTEEKITPEGARKSRIVNSGDFILSNSMSFGRPYIMKISGCIHDGWLSISGYENTYLTDFLYYLLNSSELQGQMTQKASQGGSIKNLNADIVKALEVPVPPMEVQREIVRVLDHFTLLRQELADQLSAELSARRKQYEYYRNELLTFGDDVPKMTLGNICYVQAGGTPSKKNSEYWSNGTIKWLGSSVCQNKKRVDEVTDYITEEGMLRSAAKYRRPGTTLIAMVGSTIGKVAFLDFEATTNQNVASLYPQKIGVLDESYLYYACTILYDKFQALLNNGFAMANLNFIRNLEIPVPDIKTQKAIVDILDKFEKICEDINSGLPAEIEARTKQYEYYRDKLLSFKRKEAS